MPDTYLARFTQVFVVTPAVGPIQGTPNASNGKPVPYISGFIVDANGTVVGVAKEGPNTPVSIPVQGGIEHHIALREVRSITGATFILGLL
jgi:hypothetical protein